MNKQGIQASNILLTGCTVNVFSVNLLSPNVVESLECQNLDHVYFFVFNYRSRTMLQTRSLLGKYAKCGKK